MKKWRRRLLALPLALALSVALTAPARAAELPAESAETPAAVETAEPEEALAPAGEDAEQTPEQAEPPSSGEEDARQDGKADAGKDKSETGSADFSEENNQQQKEPDKEQQKEEKEEKQEKQERKDSSGEEPSGSDGNETPAASEEEDSVFPPAGADGVCGERLSWTLKNHVLTISGTGAMYNYVGSKGGDSGELPPWSSLLGETEVGIQKVIVEEGVTTVGDFAFFLELDLQDVSLPSTLKSIGTSAFGWSGLSSLRLPEGLTSIGEGAFLLCDSLETVTIPDSVTEIGENAFSCCGVLTSVTLGSAVETVGKGAFEDCPKLKSVEIPESVTAIGQRAFGYYTGDDLETARVKGFFLSGETGSAARTYARQNLFPFHTRKKVLWPLATPSLREITADSDSVTLTWKRVSGASWYRVYRKTGSGHWQALGETTGVCYVDKTASEGSGCVYTVRCLSEKGGSCASGYDSVGLSADSGSRLALRVYRTSDGIQLRWREITGADSYQIYRSTGGTYRLLATVQDTGYLDDYSKTAGRLYSYQVYARSGTEILRVCPAKSICWQADADES